MKKIYLPVLITAISLGSCKKDSTKEPVPAPVASFTIDAQESSTISVIQSSDQFVHNTSQNGISYNWDLGNGTTLSTGDKDANVATPDFFFTYASAGTYTVTLTAKNADGQSSVAKKEVKVLVPMVKNISISRLTFRDAGNNSVLPMTKGDVWIEISKRETGSPDYKTIYKSNVITNASPDMVPINIPVTQDLVVALDRLQPESGYLVQMFGKDSTGIYLLLSTDLGGSSSYMDSNMKINSFLWANSHLSNSIDITGYFE